MGQVRRGIRGGTALAWGGKDLARFGRKALVIIGYDELQAAKTPVPQRTWEAFPENLLAEEWSTKFKHFALFVLVDAAASAFRPSVAALGRPRRVSPAPTASAYWSPGTP
jgi:hypothetical protein